MEARAPLRMEVLGLPGAGRAIAVRLDPGEEVLSSLTRIALEKDVVGGFVTVGIGSLRDTTLGFYDGKAYLKRTFQGPHELVSMTGSIARFEGAPHIHLHATLSDEQCRAFGGHFHAGTVEVLAEVLIQSLPAPFGRSPRGEVLKVLALRPGS